MAWKQDLAKLKQQLGPEPASPAPKPPPKPAPKPQGPGDLVDEDAVFLSAMGLKPSTPRPAKAAAPTVSSPSEAPVAAPPPPAPPETFEEALKDLKGLKPLSRGFQAQAAPALPPPVTLPPSPAPAPPPVVPPVKLASLPPEPSEAALEESLPAAPNAPPPVPMRFQLAAGMAIEVDGVLDLRGHSLQDAVERLKDRLGDGLVLGWRSIQVILGPDPKLHEGLLALLASGETPMVARYAQAPVPMGGSQAWLLYFTPSQPQS
ncbi:Smr/MutS family protein [Geothrix campi]|uniref:Smr/MutS family protein n=1 Tax=Geothrix campi TaxID=2966450 RepID=UPI002148FFEE|nr:Smr/MutS family protein [Geothrix sp. SG10]